jgi:hypothetical protein
MYNTLNKPIVITEEDKIVEHRKFTIILFTFTILAFFGGKEIGKQEIQSKIITDLQDGKVQCEVETYSSKDGFFKETRLGSISRNVK